MCIYACICMFAQSACSCKLTENENNNFAKCAALNRSHVCKLAINDHFGAGWESPLLQTDHMYVNLPKTTTLVPVGRARCFKPITCM